MKKAIMMLALLLAPFALQAQTQFHDLEANEAKGPVKSITQTVMQGQTQVTNFTKEGKMQREGITNAVYDENGYIQSMTVEAMGQKVTATFKWEDGKLKSQSMDMMGQAIVILPVYDENGNIVGQNMDMGGQQMNIPYKDIKYDDHGNWISRKISMMGQEMEQTRTIEYYE